MFLAITNSKLSFYGTKFIHAQSSIKRETFSKESDIKYFKLLNKYTFNARNMTISSAFHCFPTISVIHNKIKNTQLL